MQESPRRIGLFGGTFDPPHIGHLVTAINVWHALDLDEVILMVANVPWQKDGTRPTTYEKGGNNTESQSAALKLGGDAGKSGRRKLRLIDWDGDGERDILINSKYVDLLENLGDHFAAPRPLAGQKLAGHTTSPTTTDWDGDGRRELLVGAEDGRLYRMAPPRPQSD